MTKLIIITDSISMPRTGISYEETWISLLKRNFPGYDVIDRPSRGSTSARLVTEGGGGADLLETYSPALAVLQIGITECAPRLFRKKGAEFFIMNRLMPKKIIPRYVDYIKRTRGRNPQITDVEPEVFRQNILSYAQRCQASGTELLIVKILEPTDLYISKSPHIGTNINKYNSIFREISEAFPNVHYLDPVDESADVNTICVDELHINSEGHRIYFKSIAKAIEKIL